MNPKTKFLTVCVCGCGKNYTLGITGTVDGCDTCEGITRNPRDHSIIYQCKPETDQLTDMEKA